MIQVFFKYLRAILPIILGMLFSTFIVTDMKKFIETIILSIRTLVGLNEAGDVLIYETKPEQFFWTIWYLLVIVILVNGLISFMTTQLDLTFSKQFQRRQVNLDRVKLLGQLPDRKIKDENEKLLDSDEVLPKTALFYAQTVVSSLLAVG